MSDVLPDSPLASDPEQGESVHAKAPGRVNASERVIFRSPWSNGINDASQLAESARQEALQQLSANDAATSGASAPEPAPQPSSHLDAPLVTDLQFAVPAQAQQAAVQSAVGHHASKDYVSNDLTGTQGQSDLPESGLFQPSSAEPATPEQGSGPRPALHISPLTPAQGGWAAILLLLIQNLVVGIAQYWHAPLGLSLLLAFGITMLGFLAVLSYPMRLLREDSRWRTRPRLGVLLGAFVLGFVASRGFMLFGLSLWPAALSAVPPLLSKGSDMLLLFIGASICIPLTEEIAFRGLLLRGLERAKGPIHAALLASLLFGMAHGSPLQVLAIVPLAWVMARAVQYSGSLWTSVGIHILNNGLAVGLGYALRGRVTGSPLGGLEASAISEKVPFTLGLAGLLIGAASLVVATAWLKPVTAAQPATPAPRVWTVSTIFLLLLALASMSYALWLIVGVPHGANF